MEFRNREGGFHFAKRLPIVAEIVTFKFEALFAKRWGFEVAWIIYKASWLIRAFANRKDARIWFEQGPKEIEINFAVLQKRQETIGCRREMVFKESQ